MKSTIKFFQICLLLCGVFGADAVKTVPVMEGESVTLNPDLTEIKEINMILWWFGDEGSTIAQIDEGVISYPYLTKLFGARLQLDNQTGSLTIKNMRTNHTGPYKLEITRNSGTSPTPFTFSVTVYESPSVIDAGKAETKFASVMEGDSVTLQTDVTETHGDELIVWRFGDEGKLIAKCDIEAKSSPIYDTDERFRDRLKLDEKTGSLTFTNTRTTDTGLYIVKIFSSKQTFYKKFSVIISEPEPPLSSGAKAGIVVGVLLLVFAAAAFGVYLLKIPKRQKQTTETVMEGESVTLKPVTEINKGDQIQLIKTSGDKDTVIAEIRGGREEIIHDERFKDRLEVDKKTGSFTITDTRTEDSGLYKILIRRGIRTLYEEFYISVTESKILVTEGGSVTLEPETEIQKGDLIQWRFGDQDILIAEIRGGTRETHDDGDGRFRGRLKLDEKTGSLIITDITAEQSGDYKLKIISSRGTTNKTFVVTVYEWLDSVKGGESLTINPKTEIQKDDQIQWRFGDQDILIAEIRGGTVETHDDGRFRGRLKLDEKTGSLTINNMRTEHTGYYKLQISSSRGTKYKTFKVFVSDREYTPEIVPEGNVITLHSHTYKVKDEVKWFFNAEILATGKDGDINKTQYCNERFKDRLELNHQTGDLTIKNTRPSDTGVYHMKFATLGIERKFSVGVHVNNEERKISVTEGGSVTLDPKTEIQKDDQIQWMFGDQDILIAEIRGGTGETHDDDERFRGRLKLDEKPGSLTITDITADQSGVYKLQISNSRGNTYMTFVVTVSADSAGNRVNDLAVEMPPVNEEERMSLLEMR